MLSKKNTWLYLFFLAAALNLYAEISHNLSLTYLSKPLLMIFLGLHFWSNRKVNRYTNLIAAGLFFAFLGDLFLMFRTRGEHQATCFLLGLSSFFLTQLCYCFAFWTYPKEKGFVQKNPLASLPFLLFLFGNTYLLWSDLPASFRIPVLAYSTIISLMAISCCNLYKEIPNTIFWNLFIGVLLFMLSDFLIGISSFKTKLANAGLLIMTTYIAAQYLIVKGSLLLEGKERG